MISYKLAKALKEAGFQHDWGDWDGKLIKDQSFYPTLCELIDACGDEFEALAHEETAEGGEWVAMSFHSHRHARGGEHEEAVARLWLVFYAKTQGGSA